MGVNSYTWSIVKQGLQDIMLIGVEEEFVATPASSQLCKTVLPLHTRTGKNTKSQLKYCLYLIPLGLVIQMTGTHSRSY